VAFALITGSNAQSFEVVGETEVTVGTWWAYTFINAPFPADDIIIWDVTNATCTYQAQLSHHNHVLIKPTSEGHFWVSAYHPANPVCYDDLYVEVSDDYVQPPQPPSPPTISGASSADVYDVESYSMPSGKDDYDWTLPYGVSHVQEYGNIKVVRFTSAGNRTIEGKYKEDGAWSSVGYKTVSVSY
jgi:hypothetical protein